MNPRSNDLNGTPRAARRGHLRLRGARDVERDVLQVADPARMRRRVVLAGLVREHGDQPAVARVEVEVVLVRVPEIRLLEQESHAEQALPEVDRALAGRAHDRDVMHPLHLDP